MAKLFYQLGGGGGTLLNVYDSPQVLVQSDLQNSRDVLQEITTLTDATRLALAQGGIPSLGIPGGFQSLTDFDTYLDDELERYLDILDYFSYESTVENLTVRDAAWFLPEALESVSAEEVGAEGALSIDNDNGTWWQSDASGTRTIVFRVRSHQKKIEGLRLRVSNASEGRAQLQNVTIKASAALATIDNVDNVQATGVNFTWGGSNWIEYTFPTAKTGRYLKLEVPSSLHSNPDQVRIREINVRVGIINHDK